MLITFLNAIKAHATEEEYREILDMATKDIKFNKIGFNKRTKEADVINIIERSYKLLRKDEIMWIKLCTSCGYSIWSLKYNTKCLNCGGAARCTPTS